MQAAWVDPISWVSRLGGLLLGVFLQYEPPRINLVHIMWIGMVGVALLLHGVIRASE